LSALRISLACTVSDRTRAVLDGRIPIAGCEVIALPGEPEDIFFRALRFQAFDVTELSLSSYLIVTARGDSPYVGVPVFLSRAFRHSAIYVRTDRGIARPEDLAGRIVGVPEYQQTAALWVRGILADQHGVPPAAIRWRFGGLEQPGAEARVRFSLRSGIELEPIPADRTLAGMLRDGEVDGIVSPRVPSCMRDRAPGVGRLFEDFRAAEQAFYRQTGFFPIMHLVGVRRTLADAHPWLVTSVLRAFVEAKRQAMQELEQINFLRVSAPWIAADLDQVRALMGPDYWRYGVAANRAELEAITRYAFDEGLTARKLSPDELFHPATLEAAA
jgi:4,5-dihydroxyphthalate decarboxylase